MRIALACPYDWCTPGGVQVHVRELGRRLRGDGHEVLVVTPSSERPPEPWVRGVGRPVAVPYNRSVAPIDPRPWSARRVRDAVVVFAPDVVHVHEPLTPSTGMWATLTSPAPVVATFHAGADRSLLFDLTAPVLRRVARRLAVRVAVSERAAAFARDRVGGSFRIVPNGVDVARFTRPGDVADLGPGRKMLFVGRLDPRKGFAIAAEAFGMLARGRPDVRLVAIGGGRERAALGRLEAALRERVTMLGAVPHDALPAFHAACDVLLAPSLGGESFGIVLVEAMAAGLPVVASRIPGYDEVVSDGVEGYLVPPGDPASFAEATARLLDGPALAEAMGKAGRERARRYDWPLVSEEIVGTYREALAIR